MASSSAVASQPRRSPRASPIHPEHPAVLPGVVGLEREHGRRRRLARCVSRSSLEQAGRQKGRVARKHENLLDPDERTSRAAHRVPRPERSFLDGNDDAVEARLRSRARRPRRAGRRRAPRRMQDPVHHPPTEQRMEVLRCGRAHARAEPGRHDDSSEREFGHGASMAGAPGFEPGITGPKPVALPLGHAPERAHLAGVAGAAGRPTGRAIQHGRPRRRRSRCLGFPRLLEEAVDAVGPAPVTSARNAPELHQVAASGDVARSFPGSVARSRAVLGPPKRVEQLRLTRVETFGALALVEPPVDGAVDFSSVRRGATSRRRSSSAARVEQGRPVAGAELRPRTQEKGDIRADRRGESPEVVVRQRLLRAAR